MLPVQVVLRRGLTSPHGESSTLPLHSNLSEGGGLEISMQYSVDCLSNGPAAFTINSLDSLEFGRMALSVETLQGFVVTLEWRETAPPVLKNVSASPIQRSVMSHVVVVDFIS